MSELRAALRTLVEQPLAEPPPLEAVAARSRRSRARRRWMQAGSATALAAVVAGVGAWWTSSDESATNVVLGAGDVQSTEYVATVPAGYEAEGRWRLVIVRDGRAVELTNRTGPRCAAVGTIQPGDEVEGEIRGAASMLRVGPDAGC